jgi:hypothetical protein
MHRQGTLKPAVTGHETKKDMPMPAGLNKGDYVALSHGRSSFHRIRILRLE